MTIKIIDTTRMIYNKKSVQYLNIVVILFFTPEFYDMNKNSTVSPTWYHGKYLDYNS